MQTEDASMHAWNLDARWAAAATYFLSCVWLFVTPWTVARQAPLSMELSRQEYWSGLPFPPPGALADPGIEPGSLALQADSLLSKPKVHFYKTN